MRLFHDGQSSVLLHNNADGSLSWRVGGKLERVHRGGQYPESVAFHPDSRTVLSATSEGVIKRFAFDRASSFSTESSVVRSLTFSPDGSLLYIGQVDSPSHRFRFRCANVFDVQSGKRVRSLRMMPTTSNHGTSAVDIRFPHDGRRVFVAGGSDWGYGEWKVFDRWTGQAYAGTTRNGVGGLNPTCADWSPDDRWIVLAGGNVLQILNDRYAPHRVLREHRGAVRGAVFGDDGRLVSASMDGTIRFWNDDFAPGNAIGNVGDSGFSCLERTSKPNILAAGRADGSIILIDTARARIEHTFQAHSQSINALAFSPDGSRCVTASADRSIKIWETETWQEMMAIRFEGIPNYLAFHPDGQQLAVAVGGRVTLMDTRLESVRIAERERDLSASAEARKFIENKLASRAQLDQDSVVDLVLSQKDLDTTQRNAVLRELMSEFDQQRAAEYERHEALFDIAKFAVERRIWFDGKHRSPFDDLQHSMSTRTDLTADQRVRYAEQIGFLTWVPHIQILKGVAWNTSGLVLSEIIRKHENRSFEDFALAAFGLEPWRGSTHSNETAVLGMSQCRAGLYADAITTLTGIENEKLADEITAHLAIALHGVGRTDEAAKLLAQPSLAESQAAAVAEAREKIKTPVKPAWDDSQAWLAVLVAVADKDFVPTRFRVLVADGHKTARLSWNQRLGSTSQTRSGFAA